MRKYLAQILLFVCLLLSLAAPSPALAAKAEAKQPPAVVGYLNYQQVFSAYPGVADKLKEVDTYRKEAQQDYDTNAKDLPPEEKKAYADKLSRQVAQKEDQLMKPVVTVIDAAIKAVAESRGLSVILDPSVVIQGGVDITADVIAKVKQ